jgi:hypothetical protein
MEPTSRIGAQTPSLGRIVHFTVDSPTATKLNAIGGRRYNVGDKVAGIITRPLDNHTCNLMLFPDAEETVFVGNVPYSTGGTQPGTWTWPERIGEAQAA